MTTPMLIFLDTNALSQDSTLSSPGWDSLADAAVAGLIQVAISDVTVAELVRQVREKAEKLVGTIAAAHEALQAHGVEPAPVSSISTETYETGLRTRLAARHVQVLALPEVDHAQVLARDIEVRKPFSRGGKGYRDTLIWHSFLDWLGGHNLASARVYFVSTNTADFGEDNKEQLSTDLRAELPNGSDVHLVKSLSDVVTKVREFKMLQASTRTETAPDVETEDDLVEYEPPRSSALGTAERAGLIAFQAIIGEEWDSIGARPFGFDPVESASVSWVEADEDSVEAVLVDNVSDTTIWDVRTFAEIRVEGIAHRGDAFHLGGAWSVAVGDLDDHYVEVSRSMRCTLVADVRVEADEQTAEGVLTDILIEAEVER